MEEGRTKANHASNLQCHGLRKQCKWEGDEGNYGPRKCGADMHSGNKIVGY